MTTIVEDPIPLSKRRIPAKLKITDNGLVIPEGLNEDQWLEVGRLIGNLQTRMQWVIGDWWAYGGHKWGDRWGLVHSDDWEGPNYQTCSYYGKIASRIPPNERIEGLQFTHHRVIAFAGDEIKPVLLEWLMPKHEAGEKVTVEQMNVFVNDRREEKRQLTQHQRKPYYDAEKIEQIRQMKAEAKIAQEAVEPEPKEKAVSGHGTLINQEAVEQAREENFTPAWVIDVMNKIWTVDQAIASHDQGVEQIAFHISQDIEMREKLMECPSIRRVMSLA